MSSIRQLPAKVADALRSVATEAPYPRFVIDDVLDRSEYERLLSSFPDDLVGGPGEDKFVNYTIRPNTEVSDDLPKPWRELITTLRSSVVIGEFVKAISTSILHRYPAWWRWLVYVRVRNPNNYIINVAFSANYSGRYLPPHNDNSYKALALVLYFAPTDYIGLNEGTLFFRPRTKDALNNAIKRFNRLSDSRITRFTPLSLLPMCSANIHNGTQSVEDQVKNETWFYHNFENDFSVQFHMNRIAGFIKTHDSFHAVDMRKSTFAGPRRSLLININLKHSIAARLWQSFRTRVLKLSS